MSETTFNTGKSSAVSDAVSKIKKSFNELSFVKKAVEFKREAWIALSITTNQVTKFKSLATAVFILTGINLASHIVGVQIGYFKATMLMVPLQIFSFASQFFILSYLFPIVHHMMEFYQKKRNKRYKQMKAEWEAQQKATRIEQEAQNGTYSI